MANAAPVFEFNVDVTVSGDNAEFTIFDQNNEPFDEVVVVTESGTQIVYTLRNTPQNTKFINPVVTEEKDYEDISFSFENHDKKLVLVDSDADNETICIKLAVDIDGTEYISQDPQVKNKRNI